MYMCESLCFSASGVEGAASGRDVNTSLVSPENKPVSCPVCLDSDKQVTNACAVCTFEVSSISKGCYTLV